MDAWITGGDSMDRSGIQTASARQLGGSGKLHENAHLHLHGQEQEHLHGHGFMPQVRSKKSHSGLS